LAETMTYVVDLERDEAGWWVASVVGLRGCRTQGRSIRQALARVPEAIGVCVETDDDIELAPRAHLPRAARNAVERHEAARARLERDQEAVRAAAEEAVTVLTDRVGLSVRDAGFLLGLSHQRVNQVANGA
jgi:predicted RNase H-like HicB family nuclease